MTLRALNNYILFAFVDPVNSKGEFVREATASGILLKSSVDDSAKTPRWAKVLRAGPDCTSVVEGQYILLPALRWTQGTKYEGNSVWKTDEKEVVAVKDTLDASPQPIGSFILFQRLARPEPQSSSGLIIVEHYSSETPKGKVLLIGPKVEPELKGSIIYYSDANFFDYFYVQGREIAFIKEDDVLIYQPTE